MSRDVEEALWQLRSLSEELAHLGVTCRSTADFPASDSPIVAYDAIITDAAIVSVTRGLYMDGYYALAVEECCKCVNNKVKEMANRPDLDGASLMQAVFSPNAPILALSGLKSRSEKDEQLGYMMLFAGLMTGIRNPRAHEHEFLDAPEIALEMLALGQHLLRKAVQARRKRKKR